MIQVQLDNESWVALAIIAGARVAKGDEFRNGTQDRGNARNQMNDLVGCVGEYAAIVASLNAGVKVEHDLFYADGPLKKADLIANDVSFDAKALMLDPSRRYFILDRQSVATAGDKGIAAFVPVIARCFGDQVLVGNRIGIADASEWPLKDFGYGVAHARPLSEVTLQYFSKSIEEVLQAISAEAFIGSADETIAAAFAYGAALKHDGIAVWTEGKDVALALKTLNDQFIKQNS